MDDLRHQMIDAVAEVFAGSWFDPPERGVSEEIVDAVLALLDTDYFPATFAGLLAFLDRHYPADVVTGESDDIGARLVAITRRVAAMEAASQEVVDLWWGERKAYDAAMGRLAELVSNG